MKWILFFLCSFPLWASFYDIKEVDIDGKELSMGQFKGKKVLVVNIASQCGYTDQLSELESLFKSLDKNKAVVLGVPTNDFGGQTPENDQAMKEFCQKKYAVTFPLLKKQSILGDDRRPLYLWFKKSSNKEMQTDVRWNFEKFLINEKGEVVRRYTSGVSPEKIKKDMLNP